MASFLTPGEILHDRYRIERVIGRGGSGSVYLAQDLRLEGRQCALKELEYDLSWSEDLLNEARAQFSREATILARLDHPNLPKVSDFFSIENRDYLVMDFVAGQDLRSLMLQARQAGTFLPEEQVLAWAAQLGSALHYLHTQDPPILHRDIKPSNLKLASSGVLKLVDFGLVKTAAPGEVTITIIQGQGTALYTPLEQMGGDNGHTDPRSDVFSFGATLYHLLTNQPPTDVRDRFLNEGALIGPRQINPAISPRVERAVLWAMELHPDDRPHSIDEFLDALLGSSLSAYVSAQGPALARAFHPSRKERVFLYASLFLTAAGLILSLVR
jgi:serine/threonine-protein kinase